MTFYSFISALCIFRPQALCVHVYVSDRIGGADNFIDLFIF